MIRTRRGRKIVTGSIAALAWVALWFAFGALIGVSGVERGWLSGLVVGFIALVIPLAALFAYWLTVVVGTMLMRWIERGAE